MKLSLQRRYASASVASAIAVVVTMQWFAAGGFAATAPKMTIDDRPLNREGKAASYAPIIKKVAPSVVNIYSTKLIRQRPAFSDPFWRRFFGEDPDQPSRRPRTFRAQNLGSGVIVSEDGYVLTNNHVVEGADKVEVGLADGKTTYTAKIVGTDPQTDVAVLRVEARRLPAITLADSDKLEVGDIAIAIGNPFDVGQAVTLGIISALGRGGFGVTGYEDFIQTDAAINPGNSGGALVDAEGRLIGINTFILSGGSGASAGVGFAIPINLARSMMDRLIRDGKVTRGFLGIGLQRDDITPDLAKEFMLPDQSGALVTDVSPNGPAADAGLKQGDVIIEFNRKKVTDNRHLRLVVSQTSPKTKATLKVVRDGKEKTVAVTLGEMPEEIAGPTGAPVEKVEPKTDTLDGVEVADLDSRMRRQFNVPASVRGALVTNVEDGSEAFDAGLRPGDVILEMDRKPVTSADDAIAVSRKAKGDRMLLRVWTRGMTHFVTVDNSKRK